MLRSIFMLAPPTAFCFDRHTFSDEVYRFRVQKTYCLFERLTQELFAFAPHHVAIGCNHGDKKVTYGQFAPLPGKSTPTHTHTPDSKHCGRGFFGFKPGRAKQPAPQLSPAVHDALIEELKLSIS